MMSPLPLDLDINTSITDLTCLNCIGRMGKGYGLKGAEQVTHFCRLLHQPTPGDPPVTPRGTDQSAPGKPLSESQRLQKVIRELIETERTYVKDLACLIERYLEPLKEETYLSGEDIEQLFGNIQEIVLFQKQFLQSLEDAVHLEPNFNLITDPKMFRDEDLRRVLFSVGGSFLYYANHFKLYSSFCASHSKAQKVLNPETNQQLAEFLKARNPKQQHSSTLESYLIKPIQRILKYPLLLRQLKDLTDPQSDEHHHLSEALRGMEAVAEHINEMQKIYEEYGNVFDDLIRLYKDSHRMQIDLNVGDLQMYGNVNWLNALDELGKIKKGTELVTMLFVFKTGVVILAQERIKGKKKQRPPPGKPISSVDLGEVIRFQAAIRVDQLQVRSVVNETSERHGLWELIHCRSEKEGRPETIFQFASSQDAKRDFIKTIHHTIRESVRRMSIPTPKSAVRSTPPSPGSNRTQSPHIPNGQGQARRPESLSSPGSGGGTPPHGGLGASQSVGKKKGRQLRADMMVRHSMDVEDKIILPGPISSEQSIGTRSRTLTDLNCMDLADTGRMPDSTGGYPSGSQSTIASEASRSSARLLHSSNSPNNYSTAEKPQKDGLGSPIWKPRNANQKKPGPVVRNQPSIEEKSEGALHGAAYGDYSNIVYDDKNSVRLQHPNAPYVEYEDTDC